MNGSATGRFDLLGALPEGSLAIEASAGTGKTFTLAALATRLVAEVGIPASELLVVTFTRAATNELRSRMRGQMVDAAAYLRYGEPASSEDALLDHLGRASTHDRFLRLLRLERATAEFDAMTITTIHGFAYQVLSTLGADAGVDPGATLVDDASQVVAEACADVLAGATVAGHAAADLPRLDDLTVATRIGLSIPDLLMEPSSPGTGADEKSLLLVQLVRRCIALVGTRRRRAGTVGFDDVLVHLRTALDGPGGAGALSTLRNRFQVALIDELQDTDPVQWSIFSKLFGEPAVARRMVLVGDPKQSIFAFRGADVHTFIEAVAPRSGLEHRSLSVNWRSDGAMLTALNSLLAGTTFGDHRIAYSPVEPAPANRSKRLRDDRGVELPSLAIRLALGPDIDRGKRSPYELRVADVERAVYGDLAEQVVGLLARARLPGEDGTRVPVQPSDIAVLVRTGGEAEAVQAELRRRLVPAVLARGTSVLGSPAAAQWRWLLEALLRPSDPRRARGFALSIFKGLSPTEVAELDEEGLGAIQDQLHQWVETLQARGVAGWVRQVFSESDLAARVLATADGDRMMTDLQHLGELFSCSAPNGHLGVPGLLALLDSEPRGVADADSDANIATRRVESDQQAVQIMTIWVAKGLEFPIVCCPTMWHHHNGTVIYRDPSSGRRTYDAASSANWPNKKSAAARKQLADQESLGEDLRLLYVGLTRAKHHTLVWWSRATRSDRTGLAHVLFARTDGMIDPVRYASDRVSLPDDDSVLDVLRPMLDRARGTIAASVHGRRASLTLWEGAHSQHPEPELDVARLPRLPDRSRNRWSFTAVTRRLEVERFDPYDLTLSDGGASDEQASDEQASDEQADDTGPASDATAPLSPLSVLPAGAEFGTLVHAVLERVDFAAADLARELAAAVDKALEDHPVDLTPLRQVDASPTVGRRLLVDGLHAALQSPLGTLFSSRRLCDLAATDRLDELSFELLVGQAGRGVSVAGIGRLVLGHLAPSDPLRPWATELAAGRFDVELVGHLTGSIDAVVRVAGEPQRFVVVDYKTNRLSRRGEDPRAGDYSQPALVKAMVQHHYPLQALMYSVALHRYLRWRLAGYEPSRHLGGIAYLFVRGMSSAHAAVRSDSPDGVFGWAVPPALVVDLSDRMDGRASEEWP